MSREDAVGVQRQYVPVSGGAELARCARCFGRATTSRGAALAIDGRDNAPPSGEPSASAGGPVECRAAFGRLRTPRQEERTEPAGGRLQEGRPAELPSRGSRLTRQRRDRNGVKSTPIFTHLPEASTAGSTGCGRRTTPCATSHSRMPLPHLPPSPSPAAGRRPLPAQRGSYLIPRRCGRDPHRAMTRDRRSVWATHA